MTNRSDEGRARAESIFKKKEQQTRQNEKVWAERNAPVELPTRTGSI